MGFVVGAIVIASALVGMRQDRGMRAFYGLGLLLGASCILAEAVL